MPKTEFGWVNVTSLGRGWMELTFMLSTLFLVLGPIIVMLFLNDMLITLSVGYAYRSMSPPFLDYPLFPEALLVGAQALASVSAATMVFLWWRHMGELGFVMKKILWGWATVFVCALIVILPTAGHYEEFLQEFTVKFRTGAAGFEALVAETRPDSLEAVQSVHRAISRRLSLAMTHDYSEICMIFLLIAIVYLGTIWVLLSLAKDSGGMTLSELAEERPTLVDGGAQMVRWRLRSVVGLAIGVLLLALMPLVTFWDLVGNISFTDRWARAPAALQFLSDNFLVTLVVLVAPANFIILWARVVLIPEFEGDVPGLLYLRSFRIDRSFTLPIYPSFDVAMYLGLVGRIPIRAVCDQRSNALLGGAQTALDDRDWKTFVSREIERARFIVLSLDDTPGVNWELEEVFRKKAQHKTVFLGPDMDKMTIKELTAIWAKAGQYDRSLKLLSTIAAETALACATIAPDGRVVGYSTHGTTGSHRALALTRAIVDISRLEASGGLYKAGFVQGA